MEKSTDTGNPYVTLQGKLGRAWDALQREYTIHRRNLDVNAMRRVNDNLIALSLFKIDLQGGKHHVP